MSLEGFNVDWGEPQYAESPDHSTCRNCEQPITLGDITYVHDDTGFAKCGTRISGGKPAFFGGRNITINPKITVDRSYGGAEAEPVEWIG